MHRGKIIGAIVLVVAVGLVLSLDLGEEPVPPPEADQAAAPGSVADPGGVADPGSAAGPGSAAPADAPALPATGQTRLYTVDTGQSEVYWRIYRSGTLARLGHNHVISMTGLEGSVTLGSDLAAAEWQLSFPVEGLVVDDPALRARYGEDFESVPSDDDKAGTRRNMLSEDLLDGSSFPAITLTGSGVAGPLAAAELPVTISIVGRTIETRFPAEVVITDESVTVTGEHRLTHEDLGLTPFTALGGAMAVADEIDFSYRIHAVAGGQ